MGRNQHIFQIPNVDLGSLTLYYINVNRLEYLAKAEIDADGPRLNSQWLIKIVNL